MRPKVRVAVIGVDMERTGDHAICEGLRLVAAGTFSELHLLFVIDPRTVLDDGDRRALSYEAEALQRAPALLEARARRLAHELGLRVEATSLHGHGRLGDPGTSLLQLCDDCQADLLIVGAHDRRGLARWFGRSVSTYVVRNARSSVLVARDPNYAGLESSVRSDASYNPATQPEAS